MKQRAEEMLLWYGAVMGCYETLSAEERAELQDWEDANLGRGAKGTSDWPGFDRYIGYLRPPPPDPKQSLRQSMPAWKRQLVLERDAYRCRGCGSWENLQVDHIHPVSAGGSDELDNLQTLCRPCNARKGVKVGGG